MMTLLEDFKQTAVEMPWYVATVAIAVVLGVGVNAQVVCGAEGDRAKISAGKIESSMKQVATACEREARQCMSFDVPGVTMLIGVRSYWIEMTVPESAVQEKLEAMRATFGYLHHGLDSVPRRIPIRAAV